MNGPHPLRLRAENAVHSYRVDHSPDHLALLRQDGLRDLAHALMMERLSQPGPARDRHTATIDAWLG